MSNTNKEDQILKLIESYTRIKKVYSPVHYRSRIEPLFEMSEGNDGGPWRAGQDVSHRDLHYSLWKDSDFYRVLLALNEVPNLTDEEWEERFGHEKEETGLSLWLNKIRGVFSI